MSQNVRVLVIDDELPIRRFLRTALGAHGYTQVTRLKGALEGAALAEALAGTHIVGIRSRGINQRKEVVVEFRRKMMIYKREGGRSPQVFPVTDADWTV